MNQVVHSSDRHNSAGSTTIVKSFSTKALAFMAIGVVYGDLGTSPLYAIKECFVPSHGLPLNIINIYGILSLVFWTLTLVVGIKYLRFVTRADNKGEGGMLALLALVQRYAKKANFSSRTIYFFGILGIVGTSLLFSEGIITPAISVLSATEGLKIVTPLFQPLIVPLTLIILVLLFLIQKRGTARVGNLFSPIMIIWFFTIGILGISWIIKEPRILYALNPYYAVLFFIEHGFFSIVVLGAVVLCMTGTEALYADLGHFGRKAINLAWFALVYPALLLNYFGQGAMLMIEGEKGLTHPFYFMISSWAPSWCLYLMVILATLATIIASQALISGAFSLAQQAMQLGYSPRMTIVHTSSQQRGQIYIPEINTILMILCVFTVLWFKSSSALAEAYGFAVMGTMTITSILIFPVSRTVWHWPIWKSSLLTLGFLVIDIPFLLGNVTKVLEGGWFPLVIGSILATILLTWKKGRIILAEALKEKLSPVDAFVKDIWRGQKPQRVSGSAVFMTPNIDVIPPAMSHHYKHNKVFHKITIMLAIITKEVPKVPKEESIDIVDLGDGLYKVTAFFGFMESPVISPILWQFEKHIGVNIDINDISFFLGRETLVLKKEFKKIAHWRKIIFSFLARNAKTATSFFNIPPDRVVELGIQIHF